MSTVPNPDDTEQDEETAGKRSTDAMIPVIYDELRRLAAMKLANEQPGQTLSATALVHEVYLVLGKSGEPRWENPRHFYVVAAEAMRRILVDRARRKNATKRGGGVRPEPFPEDSINVPAAPEKDDEFIALDDALNKLAVEHERKARLVSLRYFVGLKLDEAAEALGISKATAKRDWVFARAWLQRELTSEQG